MYDQKKRERRKRRVDEIRGEEEESAAGKVSKVIEDTRGQEAPGGVACASTVRLGLPRLGLSVTTRRIPS